MVWSDLNDFGFGDDWFNMRGGALGRLSRMGFWPREVRGFFGGNEPGAYFPAVNVWSNTEEAVVLAEIPGVDPSAFDISVVGKTLTIKGQRPELELKDGEKYLRRERGDGRFNRTIELPFIVEPEKVHAQYKLGVLKIVLPRAEQDKPRKITIR